MSITIHAGDCRTILPSLASGSVRCCVTSPPYLWLRDYGVDGQIGLEETVDDYVSEIVAVFREVRRVLSDDGTLWLNLGDTFAQSGRGGRRNVNESRMERVARPKRASGCKPKDLIGVPWMVAFALRNDGWYLRSDIVWAKPNAMPESVTDRPTRAHEYVFLLSQAEVYFYNGQSIAEPAVSEHGSGNGFARPERISVGGRGKAEPWLKSPTKTLNAMADRLNAKDAEIAKLQSQLKEWERYTGFLYAHGFFHDHPAPSIPPTLTTTEDSPHG